jgi:two-component system chemotaxis response regulator CheB
VDFVQKPNVNVTATLTDYADELLDKIRAAHGARHFYPPRPATPNRAGKRAYALPVCRHPVCIGASTGGTEALTHLLSLLPGNFPALLITQHMPPGFTASFAARLDRFSALNVFEAQGGEKLHDGQAYLAPGGQHLRLLRRGDGFYTALSDEPPVNRHKPSVDVLFHSAVEAAGKLATGVILTGMGKDGAQGLLALRKIGAMTYGQDEDSCVVYGMPREAALIGAVQTQAPIPKIAALLEQQLLPMKSGGDG